ncbi:ATP-binding protein [Pontibacillus litoralis]|uniref:histidine kinase n=1 Tax=Pontibacillus litoralis JSM 072002 TaxID=1385512 RepID=A0A0A5G1M9_9BACI|nr:ATP-binding protein [Pontibacillus litoralis]KGX85954.1 sensor histidine kinase [Pontibacillus litoralis JSM 072002]
MFWRSLVGKLWFTILLLVSFVLLILTVLLLEFFEDYHLEQAEHELMETAKKVTSIVEEFEGDRNLMLSVANEVKDPSSRMIVSFDQKDYWISDSTDSSIPVVDIDWIYRDKQLRAVIEEGEQVKKEDVLPPSQAKVMIVGYPLENETGAVYVYQSLKFVEQTAEKTANIIMLGAGIAIVLTTIFAFFLSTRITSPLIKMREVAIELARGEFNTKVPILTHDEIGELAMAFNRMGRQLKFHINALNQEKEQLFSILSSMADGVITLNRKGEMLIMNPPAKGFVDAWYFENEVSDNELPKRLPEPLQGVLQEVVTLEKEVLKEITVQGRTWVVLVTPLYDKSYVRGAVAVLRDMTEERRLDKLREDFITNVSHELRTPISMLQGYSEAIVDDIAETTEEKNELAQIIYDESLRMGRLVNELLDLAHMEVGKIQLNKEATPLKEFIDRVVRKFHGIAKDYDVELEIDMGNMEEEVCVHIDPDRMEQVLTNLIDNAIRHTQEDTKIKVSLSQTETNVMINIEDQGYGIPEEDLPFIFERFYKADKSRQRKQRHSGTGIGLSIAKNIIEAHRGSITVYSKEGDGTTFTVIIPLLSSD